MILAKLTKRAIGVTLWGDEFDLKSQHETGHQLIITNSDDGIFDGPLEELVILSVLYDIRKAKDGMREKWNPNPGLANTETMPTCYLGEKITLPFLLLYCGFAKIAAREGVPSFRQLADIAILEAAIFEAISEVDYRSTQEVHKWLDQFSAHNSDKFKTEVYPPALPSIAAYDYIMLSGKKKRLQELPTILSIATPDTAEFEDEVMRIHEVAKQQNIPPDQLQIEWPEFEW